MKKLPLIIAFIFSVLLCTGQNINKAEYFVDNDPGFGLANAIPVSVPGEDVSLSFQVNISGLSQGFHLMVLRARNESGRWSSTTHQQVFYVYKPESSTASDINKAEYFIDIDPGFGLATTIPVSTPGKDLLLSFGVNTSGLSQGFHIMVLRARDKSDRWSTTHQQVFYVYKTIPSAASNITGIEYFIDSDPGFGKGTPVNVAIPGSDITADFIANLSSLSTGDHIIYIRVKDALKRWSHTYIHAFSMTITGIGKEKVVPWFRMYPNPNEGNFIIDFADLQSRDIKITINDMNGRTVYSNEVHGENIPLSVDLPTGIYMLTVKAGDQSFMQKLVINK